MAEASVANRKAAFERQGGEVEAEEAEKPDIVQYSRRITSDMTDEERYNVLKDKTISITAKTDTSKLTEYQSKNGVSLSPVPRLTSSQRKKLFQKIGNEFNVFKEYSNKDIELSFNYFASNLHESLLRQRKNYEDFAKLLSCFDDVVDSAIGIEVHNRNAQGYKPDPTLSNVYVLVSAFEDGDNVVPVKLEVKEFSDKPNTLYVAIALESIKKDEVIMQGNTENGVTQYTRSSIIRLSDFLSNVNPKDESFTKYIPEQFFKARDRKTEEAIQTTETVTFQSKQAKRTDNRKPTSNPNVQYQRRTESYTDREVLEKAADELLNRNERRKYSALTDGDIEVLRIFKRRLNTLDKARETRLELLERKKSILDGREAKSLSASEKEELRKVQSSLDNANSRIKAAEAAVTDVGRAQTAKKLLREARTIIEREATETQGEAYREKRNTSILKAKIVKTASDFSQMIRSGTDRRYIPISLMQSCIDVCLMLDTSGNREGTKAKAKYSSMTDALRDLKEQYDELLKNQDYDYKSEYDEEVSEYVNEA